MKMANGDGFGKAVATASAYKKSNGMMRSWRERQVTVWNDGWLTIDKKQRSSKCIDLVESEIGHQIVKVGVYHTFAIIYHGVTNLIGFLTNEEAIKWMELTKEIADDNAGGRREWIASFRNALELEDITQQRRQLLQMKPREWNKEWQYCLRSHVNEHGDPKLQMRRLSRMYMLWLQFNQFSALLYDAIVYDPNKTNYIQAESLPNEHDDAFNSKETFLNMYQVSTVLFKLSKDSWQSYKQMKEEVRYFNLFKELYEVFRSLAHGVKISDAKRSKISHVRFPLVATFESIESRVLAIALPPGENRYSVMDSNTEVQLLLESVGFLRPTQVLNALPYMELPVFTDIHRNSTSDDLYLLKITSPYSNVLKTSLRSDKYTACLVPFDTQQHVKVLSKSELEVLKESLKSSKKGLVHYLQLKNIKNQHEVLPYHHISYFSAEITSSEVNKRASSFSKLKLYGDVVFTFHGSGRMNLNIKESMVLMAGSSLRTNIRALQNATDMNTINRLEQDICMEVNSNIEHFASKLTTFGDKIHRKPQSMSMDYFYVPDGSTLRKQLGIHGINVKFLPVLLGYLQMNHHGLRVLIASEVIAKLAKYVFRYLVLYQKLERNVAAASVVNAVMGPLRATSDMVFNTDPRKDVAFWDIDGQVLLNIGNLSSSAAISSKAVLDINVYRILVQQNPNLLFHSMLRSLRIYLNPNYLQQLVLNSNSLQLEPLSEHDIAPITNSQVTLKWSILYQSEVRFCTSQIRQILVTNNAKNRSEVSNLTNINQDTISYLDFFEKLDQRVCETNFECKYHYHNMATIVTEHLLVNNITSILREAIQSARMLDYESIRQCLNAYSAIMQKLPPNSMIPVGVYLASILVDTFLWEKHTSHPNQPQVLIDYYLLSIQWLRTLFRPSNCSQLNIELSAHPLTYALYYKLNRLLQSNPHLRSQYSNAFVPLYLTHYEMNSNITNSFIQDIDRLLTPLYFFKLIEMYILEIDHFLLPKESFVLLSRLPISNNAASISASFIMKQTNKHVNYLKLRTHGAAFLNGKVMGLSLDEEQKNFASNQNESTSEAISNETLGTELAAGGFESKELQCNGYEWLSCMPYNLPIHFVSCGYRHAALISSYNHLYTFGYGECGRLGHGDEVSYNSPKLVEFFTDCYNNTNIVTLGCAVNVACGREHTMVITKSGNLYGFGWGEAGRLGTGESGKCLLPVPVYQTYTRFKKVACGREHTLALSHTNDLYTFGAGFGGRLGHGDEDDVAVPTKVEYFNDMVIVDMDGGECHSAAVSENGEVYTWGFGESGALGQIDCLENCVVPKLVNTIQNARQVSCGAYHTAVVTAAGELFGWGDCMAGQLGDQVAKSVGQQSMLTTPSQIKIHNSKGEVVHIRNVNCGSFTTGVLTDDKEVYTWGSPEAGNGAPLNLNDSIPKKLQFQDGISINSISCGAYQTIITTTLQKYQFE